LDKRITDKYTVSAVSANQELLYCFDPAHHCGYYVVPDIKRAGYYKCVTLW